MGRTADAKCGPSTRIFRSPRAHMRSHVTKGPKPRIGESCAANDPNTTRFIPLPYIAPAHLGQGLPEGERKHPQRSAVDALCKPPHRTVTDFSWGGHRLATRLRDIRRLRLLPGPVENGRASLVPSVFVGTLLPGVGNSPVTDRRVAGDCLVRNQHHTVKMLDGLVEILSRGVKAARRCQNSG